MFRKIANVFHGDLFLQLNCWSLLFWISLQFFVYGVCSIAAYVVGGSLTDGANAAIDGSLTIASCWILLEYLVLSVVLGVQYFLRDKISLRTFLFGYALLLVYNRILGSANHAADRWSTASILMDGAFFAFICLITAIVLPHAIQKKVSAAPDA